MTLRLARGRRPHFRNQLLGSFAPAVLILLPLLWSLGLVASFTAIFWGITDLSTGASFDLSFSSLTTLGFVTAPTRLSRTLASGEALMGLAIVALMISFLPTLYTSFSRREIAVGRLTTRAGAPPSPIDFLSRLSAIGQLDHIGDRWMEWEDWFVELGETHTTFPALIYFRSSSPDRSWLTAAEVALDTAAIVTAAELTEHTGQADTMMRSGYLALRSIADYYRIEPESDTAPLSIGREDVEALLDQIETVGLVVGPDRESVWLTFAGWRRNYDQAVAGLRELVGDLPSHWIPDDDS